jgi:hypothetical protein
MRQPGNTRKLTRATNCNYQKIRNTAEIEFGTPREWRDAPNREFKLDSAGD